MILLKSTLGFSTLIFFIIAAFNGSLSVVDRAGAHARLAAALLSGAAAMASLIFYFKVST